MATYYFDTRALLKLYVEEEGSKALVTIAGRLDKGELAILDITLVESRAAIRRRQREGDIARPISERILTRIDSDASSYFLVAPSSGTFSDAAALIDSHPLRALDAIQLAGCLSILPDVPPPLVFVSADRGLCIAARQEGLTVLNPLDSGEVG